MACIFEFEFTVHFQTIPWYFSEFSFRR